ncbi:hypothetical protein A8C56_13220 [Niabella ginsenosidivorans]|uniref:Alpha-L-rhamnosidase six-hairpin glycosidase domain-containing protein n=1 Tax=Niabella ginsenosidivorans TaxID=1176587 RepID=A0A1A9I550_9BACT|nr:hypothetical protein [Niabella ginsenosidivorans]ANH81812.1 hypothetical protein A8C56_13220 [Niabella ginsenosidivorans]
MKILLTFLACFTCAFPCFSNSPGYGIIHNKINKTISITTQNGLSAILIGYAEGCYIRKLLIKGENKLSSSGVYTGFITGSTAYTSKQLSTSPDVFTNANSAQITNITYGNGNNNVMETWNFVVTKKTIEWRITRQYTGTQVMEDIAFPKWNFAGLSVWKGGIIDNGGMVWCKYLSTINDTYGVHTGGTIYWNDKNGDALSIQGKALKGNYIATKYSHSPDNEFTSTQIVCTQPIRQRHNLSRFVHARPDVFAPVITTKGTISAQYTISYVDYFKTYNRGNLQNINAAAVRELLNTTARYGVVDNNIVGGNGWITNWKCLHEPFFAQVALAVADSNYTNNLAATLDQEVALALQPDGRVLSRWHNAPGDEIPGTFNDSTGYYEAMWGYTIDSQTGYVINVSGLFNLTGNLEWLKNHVRSCRKALDWLIRRDSNGNGIFEMMNNNISEAKCSDWTDIVWVSFENAFVNAQLYDALRKWAECERILGNMEAVTRYETIAQKLKEQFNRPVKDGGFWSEEKKQFVYWKDNDGSVHGDNLVTPVQFMAIATGLCDDKERIHKILHQIEERTVAENLFHWPLCFDSYKQEEVSGGNWPFPQYENGDIFPTWGYIGVQSYIHYDKQLALKYIINLLKQYEKDGLSFQRYSRATQKGSGTDILSGICTGITALYSDIYGIQPRWNRLVISPNLVPALYGTDFTYPLRGNDYKIQLNEKNYQVRFSSYTINYNTSFGIAGDNGSLRFYPGDQDKISLSVCNISKKGITLSVIDFNKKGINFGIKEKGRYNISLSGLTPGTAYPITINGSEKTVTAAKDGVIHITGYQIK